MRAILGTIALEPNRWTALKEPRMDLIELLPAIRRAGFDQLEIWQNHIALRSLAAIRALKAKGDETGVGFTYIGVYPVFTAEGLEAREQERILSDILDKAEILGTRRLKIMLACGLRGGQATPEQLQMVVDRFGPWYREALSRGIRMAVELHGGTVFDPVEAGERFMQTHPELDFTICYQPYDFQDTEKALALADRFAGRISHLHLQAPQPREKGGLYDLLEEGGLDYRRLLPHILRRNPGATLTLEFVRDCIQKDGAFDVERVLANARKDADFVERILKSI
jgi:sugar phosphate isomerase/epimerase